MSAIKKVDGYSGNFILVGLKAWILTALVLLLLLTAILSVMEINPSLLGIASSAISFISAAAAGSCAAKAHQGRILLTGLITAAVISATALMLGYITVGAALDGGAVLSLVTFTFSGAAVGSVLLPGKLCFGAGKRRRRRFT